MFHNAIGLPIILLAQTFLPIMLLTQSFLRLVLAGQKNVFLL